MTSTEATARVIEIMREFVRVHNTDIGNDAMFEYAGMADDAKDALAAYDNSTINTNRLHRIVSSQTITPTELRLAGLLALEWWCLDHIWFIGTFMGWW